MSASMHMGAHVPTLTGACLAIVFGVLLLADFKKLINDAAASTR
jgi:hypothetical protein